jgi:hypothetical protein
MRQYLSERPPGARAFKSFYRIEKVWPPESRQRLRRLTTIGGP